MPFSSFGTCIPFLAGTHNKRNIFFFVTYSIGNGTYGRTAGSWVAAGLLNNGIFEVHQCVIYLLLVNHYYSYHTPLLRELRQLLHSYTFIVLVTAAMPCQARSIDLSSNRLSLPGGRFYRWYVC
jgi:hypothetical protein